MALFNRLARLAPQNYAMPPTNVDQPNQGVQQNPLAQLSGSQDALGSDTNTPLLDLLQKHLINNYPNPQDYQPSTARKVLGAVAGFGAGASPSTYQGGAALGFNFNPQAAIGTTRAITDEPYQKALGQYDTRAKALEGGAGIEEKQFTNKRLLEQNQTNIQFKLMDLIRKSEADENLNQYREQLNNIRADAAKKQNVHWVTGADGIARAMKINPEDGTVDVFQGPKVGQSMDEKMTKAFGDFVNRQGVIKGRELAVEGARNADITKRQNIAIRGRKDLAQFKTTLPSKATGVKNPSVIDIQRAHAQAVQDVLGDPSNAGKYTDIVNKPDTNNKYYTLKPTDEIMGSSGFFGIGAKPNNTTKYKELLDKIDTRQNAILQRAGKVNGGQTTPYDIEEVDDNDTDSESEQ